jgi:hypothetical protein
LRNHAAARKDAAEHAEGALGQGGGGNHASALYSAGRGSGVDEIASLGLDVRHRLF